MPKTLATHDTQGNKPAKKELSQKEKDLKEIISKIENVHSKAVKKLDKLQNSTGK